MKKHIILLLILTVLWSCKKEIPVDYVILTGNINNTKGGELKISSINGFKKTINVKDTGTFSDTLYILENGLYNLQFNNIGVTPYLSKGASVHLDVDAKQHTSTLKLSGDHAELNNYFAYRAGKEYDFVMNREANYNMDEDAFVAKTDAFQKDLETRLEAVENIPEGLKAKELRAINYSRLTKKEIYERMYNFLNKVRDFKVSEGFKKELSEISLDNTEDYLYSPDYRQMISLDAMAKMAYYAQKDSLHYYEAQVKAVSEIKNEVIRNGELYKNVSKFLTRSNNKEKDLNDFLEISTNENHKASVKALYEFLKVLDAGQPSPKFENYENYTGGTTSLSDLKGKYVYIDVWATWCGPCKYEIPFLKKVEKQYHDKNIAFVSISVDKQKDKDKWKKMIAEKELGGIQLITDNDFNTKFISAYKISGIPHFILLDPEGNIVKSMAPRPSEEKLVELFNELNI
ncbi:TlpA family protein disulfide reductase [Flavivirga rizhaonensis]|uniref:TlpA family protein disulfide reductase n=1 Tax=Flavivirga rizhaonensis TaxID=2559571 RepID=A0A4S1DYB8_9FLAO|nr:TlpA disulfide reductase family protein [Flavivirga rizhaonensis]TGV03099.1 TlpA family protein disulfide reductase [Flavivirga rizhaonensis]